MRKADAILAAGATPAYRPEAGISASGTTPGCPDPRNCYLRLPPQVGASIDMEDDGRTIYMWLRLADGRGALWDFRLGAPPGQDQRICVVEGA